MGKRIEMEDRGANVNTLKEMYIEKRMTQKEIGEKLDVSRGVVSRWLDENKIEKRKRGIWDYEKVKQYIEVESGSGCKMISREYKNYKEELHLKCACGELYYKSFMDFRHTYMLCSDCSGKKKWSYQEVRDYIKKNSNEESEIVAVESEYVNTTRKIEVRCKCGEIFERPFSMMKHHENFKCRDCGRKRYSQSTMKKNNDIVIQELTERKLEFLGFSGKGQDRVANIKCECGESFERRVNQLVKFDRWECNTCRFGHPGKAGYTYSQLEELIAKNSDCKLLERISSDNASELKIECGCGEPYIVSLNRFLNSNQRMCLECQGITFWSISKIRRYIIDNNLGFTLMSHEYEASVKLDFLCDCGTPFSSLWNSIVVHERDSCRICRETMSNSEREVHQILSEYGAPFEYEYHILDDDNLRNCRFDFYVDGKFVIECDGEGHFYPINFGSMPQKELEKYWIRAVERDMRKNAYCREHDIPLIRIPYWHFDKLESIVASTLIKYEVVANISKEDLASLDGFTVDDRWSHTVYILSEENENKSIAEDLLFKGGLYKDV